MSVWIKRGPSQTNFVRAKVALMHDITRLRADIRYAEFIIKFGTSEESRDALRMKKIVEMKLAKKLERQCDIHVREAKLARTKAHQVLKEVSKITGRSLPDHGPTSRPSCKGCELLANIFTFGIYGLVKKQRNRH